jgi:hypothetical protein
LKPKKTATNHVLGENVINLLKEKEAHKIAISLGYCTPQKILMSFQKLQNWSNWWNGYIKVHSYYVTNRSELVRFKEQSIYIAFLKHPSLEELVMLHFQLSMERYLGDGPY